MVRSLFAEATLQCKNRDDINDTAEVSAALKEQCYIDVASKAIHLGKGPQDTIGPIPHNSQQRELGGG